MDIDIKGDIIEDDCQWIYDWFGMSATSPKKITDMLKQANGEPITVKINSPGGSVFAGSEIYTEIRNYNGEVNIQVVGLAASAASVIAMAGKSSMSPTAQIMVHNVSSSASGDYRDMDHMSDILKNANDTIANAYMCKSGMTREQALELMNNETFLNAEQAKELGLIDEVMFDGDNKSFNISGLSNKLSSGLYNSYSNIPIELIEKLKNTCVNQPITDRNNMVDFLFKQKAQSQLDLLRMGGIK